MKSNREQASPEGPKNWSMPEKTDRPEDSSPEQTGGTGPSLAERKRQDEAGMLNRINAARASAGLPPQESLSKSAYDETQGPDAVAAREEARKKSVESIADKALEANKRKLEEQKAVLAELEQKVANASALARWYHQGKVDKQREEIRQTETFIRARKAQLEKQTTEEPSQEDQLAA